MYKEVFALRLKARREELGLSQYDVSKETEINQPTISKYEKGALEPNLETLGKLANYYEVSIDWLMGNPHNKKGNIVKAAIEEFKRETEKTIYGAKEQGIKGEEYYNVISRYMEEDAERIIKQYE